MCLKIDEKLTEKGLKGRKIHSNGMVKVWKVLDKFRLEGILCSPHKSQFWQPGWNVSDRPSKRLLNNEKKDKRVYKGIHVLMTKRCVKNFMDLNEIAVPVYVSKEDFVACGKSIYRGVFYDAVFTKVFLEEEDYNNALKGT